MDAVLWTLLTVLSAVVVKMLLGRVGRRRHTGTVPPLPDGPDVLVIGAGVLGSAMATALARDGRRVVVVERSLDEPDRIVGELLQPGGRRALRKLGLSDVTEGIDAQPVFGYMIHNMEKKQSVQVPYPALSEDGIAGGRAFHHGRFIMSLRRAAQNEPNVTFIEGSATELLRKDGVVTGAAVKRKGHEQTEDVTAKLTVIADGCFSKFRKELVRAQPYTRSHFVGTIMTDCPQYREQHAEIVLANPSPILVYQIGAHETRVLVDVPDPMPSNIKEYLRAHVHPQLAAHLQQPFLDALDSSRVRSMPNSFLPAVPIRAPGAILLGDALNMRHPLTGAGMTVALSDTVLWRDLLRDIPDLQDYDAVLRAQEKFQRSRKNAHSFVVNVLSMALYELFAAQDVSLKYMQNACFTYFTLGGECVNGPVGLLSILKPYPYKLIGHFFAVALYAVYFAVRAQPWWAWHRGLARGLSILWGALQIIVPLTWSEVKTLL